MNTADATDAPPTAPQAPPPPVDDPRRGGRLRIYARDNGTRFRIIADDVAVRDAELVEVAYFDYRAEAEAVAQACADFLALSVMAPDKFGWHMVPPGARLALIIPTMLQAARNMARAKTEAAAADKVELDPDEPLSAPAAATPRQGWTLRRVAWFGFLVGLGWTAKRIAADELIRSTPENVWRQAHRFGLSLSAAPQGQVCIDLPLATLATIDKAAAAAHLQRDAFLKRLLIRAAKDGYGMVVVNG